MEENVNRLKLQGILKSDLEKTGDIRKIKYKGGNEEKISKIVERLKEYFVSKKFLIDSRTNSEYAQELQSITRLLVINTEFKNGGCLLNIKEFSHLIKAIPTLSKCVLANVIIELDLAKYYCLVVSTLPFYLAEELLTEIIICIKQCEPKKALRDTHTFLDAIIKILTILDGEQNQQNEKIIEQLTDIASEMLKNISGFNRDWIQEWKATQINEHIGHTLLCLLKLLRCCPVYTSSLSQVIDDMIRVSITILKAVTLNVFCVWAEVKYEQDQPLQIVIAGEAYLIIEHLHKYKPAEELIQMLGNIARKPKTINEIILEADVATMITNINKCDGNQKLWFKGLMNTSVLQNEEALICLDKWADLCCQDDVMRLLNMSVYYKELRVKKLVLKCARSLSIEDLALVSTQYIYKSNTNNLEMESLKNQLTLLLNKKQNSNEVEENFIKEIYLLLLQNADFVVTTLYTECSKKSGCTHYLRKLFENIKTTIGIHNLSKTALIKVLRDHPPTLEIIACYKELLNTLLDLQYFQNKVVLCEIFMPPLQQWFEENNYEMLSYTLQLLNLISINHTLHQDILPVITLLGNILEKTRCQFFTFSIINQHIVQETTDLLMKFIPFASNDLQYIMQYKDFLCGLEINNAVNKFYFTTAYLELGNRLLTYVYPRYNVDNNAEVLANLIKLLPTCITSEWLLIAKELESRCGYQRTLLLLEDTLILLCQITSQTKDKETAVNNGLKFCLQQYGIVIKDVLQLNHASLEDEIILTKSVCNILRDIPNDIRKKEGLQLTNLLSEQSLHSLKNDKEFILSLVAMDDSTISQVLAQKMLL